MNWRMQGMTRVLSAVPTAEKLRENASITGTSIFAALSVTLTRYDTVKDVQRPYCKVKLSFSGFVSNVWRGSFSPFDGEVVPVAIKCILATRTFKRFRREASIWEGLHHPNILPLLETYESPEMCLISPWCENGNINSYLQHNPNADKLGLLIRVSDALNYLHTRKIPIIHGNLSPENIYIDGAGKALVSGFGTSEGSFIFSAEDIASGTFDFRSPSVIASALNAEYEEDKWAHLREILDDISNMRYFAPEMVNGHGWSTASDIYTFALPSLKSCLERSRSHPSRRTIN
ncbi:hypothetical protein FRB99_001404 [Tulasnella sp. 403]|nr:hypothetical protein FRB99_001404 [Tulasnella sp. 403]